MGLGENVGHQCIALLWGIFKNSTERPGSVLTSALGLEICTHVHMYVGGRVCTCMCKLMHAMTSSTGGHVCLFIENEGGKNYLIEDAEYSLGRLKYYWI